MKYATLKKDCSTRAGNKFKQGEKFSYAFLPSGKVEFTSQATGQRLLVKPRICFPLFGAPFTKEPTIATLERWEREGYCKTITGEKTDPDGHGWNGAPSWLVALKLI